MGRVECGRGWRLVSCSHLKVSTVVLRLFLCVCVTCPAMTVATVISWALDVGPWHVGHLVSELSVLDP